MSKPIRLSAHAAGYFERRGFTEAEIVHAIRTGEWEAAPQNRLQCRVNLPFGREWNGVRYATKQVRPIFVDEPDEIVVITVYTYFF